MKLKINKLPRVPKTVSLSGYHNAVVIDLAKRLGCVNLTSPKAGKPTLALFLEAIADGRLKIFDAETKELVQRDSALADRLQKALDNDRKSNPMRLESVMASRAFALRMAKERKLHEQTSKRA